MSSGKSGGAKAALYALNILSEPVNRIEAKLDHWMKNMAEKIYDKNKKIAEMVRMNYIKKLEAEK